VDFVRFPLQDWTRGSAHPVSDNETQQIAEPIYYDDGEVIHACESAIMDRGIPLVWTKCDMTCPTIRASW
jgi:hypothetical protein